MRKVFSQYGTSYKEMHTEGKVKVSGFYKLLMMDGINMDLCYQGKLVRVDPDDAEVGVVGVLLRHLFQNFQELITVWVRVQENES